MMLTSSGFVLPGSVRDVPRKIKYQISMISLCVLLEVDSFSFCSTLERYTSSL